MASKPPLKSSSKAAPQAAPRLTVLRRRGDYLRLLKLGHRLKPSPWLLLNYAGNEIGVLRCGWTLPRKVGPAVVRNRLKRWSREYFRALIKRDGNEFPIDLNLVFRKSDDDIFKNLDYEGFSKVVDRGWSQVRKRVEGDSSARARRVSDDRN